MKKLHFSTEEFAQRRKRTIEAMTEQGLDGLLLFRQESTYYLTGFDTYGFVFFTCLYLGADGTMTLLTRTPDLRQAQLTSVIEDVRIWIDREGVNPALQLREILEEKDRRGKRLGIELESFGLTGKNYQRVAEALDGFCTLVDASHLVSRLRLVKSPAELAFVRRAAELADEVLLEFYRLARPGAFEGDILAHALAKVFQGDGDFPAHDYIIGSGEYAFLGRYHSGRRRIGENDQVFFEFGVPYRHYHANILSVVLTGTPTQRHRDYHRVSVEALSAIKEGLKPGRPLGDAFDAHARVYDQAGYGEHRMHACGYSLGATFIPNWMDWPMIFKDNPLMAEPNMIFFPIALLSDSVHNVAMGVANTVVITETGCEDLSKVPLDLVVN